MITLFSRHYAKDVTHNYPSIDSNMAVARPLTVQYSIFLVGLIRSSNIDDGHNINDENVPFGVLD